MSKEVKRPRFIGLLGLGLMFVWCISILYSLQFIHHHFWMMQAFGYISLFAATVTFIGIFLYTSWLERIVWPKNIDRYNGYYD